MEDRLPFIAAIISGLITTVATAYYISDLLPLMIVIIIVSTVLLRFNAWALIGGFLTGLAFLEYEQGGQRFWVIIGLLVGGAVLQVITALLVGVRSARIKDRSTYWQNVVFAGIGVTAVFLAYLVICRNAYPPQQDLTIIEQGKYLLFCVGRFVLEPYLQMSLDASGQIVFESFYPAYQAVVEGAEITEALILPTINVIAAVFLRTFIIAPPTYAALFAALRQIGFRFWDVGLWLKQTFRAWRGGALIGTLGLFIQIPIFIGAAAANTETMTFYLILLGLVVGYFFYALGAGWGARWRLQ
ncbi:MAG: hypothetical protein H6656_21620 [Ardenticatenaceae bacterium]|nr:hypothetical protein [Ardenticatenaceae bacterium]